jgi:hypothetical protein
MEIPEHDLSPWMLLSYRGFWHLYSLIITWLRIGSGGLGLLLVAIPSVAFSSPSLSYRNAQWF